MTINWINKSKKGGMVPEDFHTLINTYKGITYATFIFGNRIAEKHTYVSFGIADNRLYFRFSNETSRSAYKLGKYGGIDGNKSARAQNTLLIDWVRKYGGYYAVLQDEDGNRYVEGVK